MKNDRSSHPSIASITLRPILKAIACYLLIFAYNSSVTNPIPLTYGAIFEKDLENDRHEFLLGQPQQLATDNLQSIPYTSYVIFMMVVLLCDLAIETLKIVKKGLIKPKDLLEGSADTCKGLTDQYSCISCLQQLSRTQLRRLLVSTAIRVLQYSLLYCILYTSTDYVLTITGLLKAAFKQQGKLWRSTSELIPSREELYQPELNNHNSIFQREDRAGQVSSYLTPSIKSHMIGSKRMLDSSQTQPEIIRIEQTSVLNSLDYSWENTGGRFITLTAEPNMVLVVSDENWALFNVSALSSPVQVKSYQDFLWSQSTFVAPNAKIVASVTGSRISVIDLTNSSLYKAIDLEVGFKLYKSQFVFSPDCRTAFLIAGNGARQILYEIDLNSPEYTQKLNLIDIPPETAILRLSHDGRILFYVQDDTITFMDTSKGIFTDFTLCSQATNIQSFILSKNSNTMYLLRGDPLVLHVLDMTDPTTPVNITTIQLNSSELVVSDILLSPNDNVLIVVLQTQSLVIDLSQLDITSQYISSSLSSEDQSLFLPDSQTLVSFNRKLKKLQVSKILIAVNPNEQYNHMNLLASFYPTNGSANAVALAPNEREVYVACDAGLEIFTLLSSNSLVYKKLIPLTGLKSISVSNDGKTAFVGSAENLYAIDIASSELLSSIAVNSIDVSVSADDKRLTVLTDDSSLNAISVDISDLRAPKIAKIQPFEGEYNTTSWDAMFMSQGGTYGVSITFTGWSVFNITDPASISFIIEIAFEYSKVYFMTASQDGRSLYIVITEFMVSSGGYFKIYNISNMYNIHEIGELHLAVLDQFPMTTAVNITDTLDSKTVFLSISNNFYIIDTTEKTSPSFINFIIEDKQSSSGSSIVASLRQSPGFVLTTNGAEGIRFIDLEAQYTTYIPQKTFQIGVPDSTELVLVKKIMPNKFNLIQSPHKFLKVSRCGVRVNGAKRDFSYRVLPGWMSFDRENRILILTPGSGNSPKDYLICSSVSTKLSTDTFSKISVDSNDLMFTLVTLGYIDNEGYLSPSFNPESILNFLPSSYNSAQEIMIREAMKSHYFETAIQISLKPSLGIMLDTEIQISTLAQQPINVRISLQDSINTTAEHIPACRFVTYLYALITPNFDPMNTTIEMQGPLFDINQALKLLQIDLADGVESCNGSLTIIDHLNPSIDNQMISNITNFFKKNKLPEQNTNMTLTLQQEINKVKIFTGSYFNTLLNQDRFMNQKVTYSIKHPEETSWLTLNGLFLSGTPPEQLWPSTYDVEVIVRNEYKSITLFFTINVHYGMGYIVKILAQLAGILGLWIYFHTIVNVVGKRYYRYPKDIMLQVKTTIPHDQILPVPCIEDEMRECWILLCRLEEKVARSLNQSSASQVQILQYFLDPVTHKINHSLLIEELQNAVATASNYYFKRLKLYTQDTDKTKQLINQLIVNHLVMVWIDTKEEKQTRKVFQKLKYSWLGLVESKNEDLKWQLSLDEAQVREMLYESNIDLNQLMNDDDDDCETKSPYNIQNLEMSTMQSGNGMQSPESFSDSKSSLASTTLEVQLISAPASRENLAKSDDGKKLKDKHRLINFHLLTQALLSHAYTQQSLNYSSTSLTISSKEKVDQLWWCPKFIARPLKFDLRPIAFGSGGNMGYGINCHVSYGVIHFSGLVEETFEKKTMVIQISRKYRIIREIWLYGVKKSTED